MRKLDVLNINAPAPRPQPVMPSACESGGCGGSDAPVSVPLAIGGTVSIDGVEIGDEEIAREMQYHPAATGEEAWIEAARALVVRELLRQECSRQGLEKDDDEESGIQALLEAEVTAASPDEDECRQVYDAQRERFHTPDLFESAHILIEPEEDNDDNWAAARLKAERIIVELDGKAARFAAAARLHSSCTSAQQDGSLGQIRRGELVEAVERELEALGEGAISQTPIRSRFGWHILLLRKRIAGRQLPYDMVRDKIADMLEARSWTMEATRYIASLAADRKVAGVDLGAG